MATLKQRVHRMNSSGSYDTIHYETDSSCVLHYNSTVKEHLDSIWYRINENPYENLMSNWYFLNPIWYPNMPTDGKINANSGSAIQNWNLYSDSTDNFSQPTSDGILISNTNGTYCNFEHAFNPASLKRILPNSYYTISFVVDDVSKINQVFMNCGSAYATVISNIIQGNLISYTFRTPASVTGISTGIQTKQGITAYIKAAKLERGTTQTLYNESTGEIIDNPRNLTSIDINHTVYDGTGYHDTLSNWIEHLRGRISTLENNSGGAGIKSLYLQASTSGIGSGFTNQTFSTGNINMGASYSTYYLFGIGGTITTKEKSVEVYTPFTVTNGQIFATNNTGGTIYSNGARYTTGVSKPSNVDYTTALTFNVSGNNVNLTVTATADDNRWYLRLFVDQLHFLCIGV